MLRIILAVALAVGLASGAHADARATLAAYGALGSLQHEIVQADRRGDLAIAAQTAEKCIETSKSLPASPWRLGNPYCVYYLAVALRYGRGIPIDERRAFVLMSDLSANDEEAQLALAEAYLDGAGTSRNLIEAGILAWRVQHGGFSIYSDYWGLCEDCNELWDHEKAVEKRVNHELTSDEKSRAAAIGAFRFPALEARIEHRDAEIEGAAAIFIGIVGGLVWWGSIRRKPQRQKLV